MRKPHIKLLVENNVRQGFFERDQFESVRAICVITEAPRHLLLVRREEEERD